MVSHTAILKFVDSQKRLLRKTYDAAWLEGVAAYRPVERMHEAAVQQQDRKHKALVAGVGLLARKYIAPTSPDPVRRAVALAPAYTSLNRMTGELLTLPPAPPVMVGMDATAASTTLMDWATSNAYRLDGGDSVAWAGESAGYSEAAAVDEQLVIWISEDDESVCEDCSSLASMPPMPLADWPSQPGDASTSCDVGCRCSMDASDVQTVPGDTYTPVLSDAQQATITGLMDAHIKALVSVMGDAQYLQ